MSTFKQLQILKQPKSGQFVSDNTLYWKEYEVINSFKSNFTHFK